MVPSIESDQNVVKMGKLFLLKYEDEVVQVS